MCIRLLTVWASLAFLVAAGAGVAAVGDVQARGAMLTFSDGRSIYSVSDRGGRAVLLLRGLRDSRRVVRFLQPAWSRDGQALAVVEEVADPGPIGRIREADIGVGSVREVRVAADGALSGRNDHPDWSPDGARVVAASCEFFVNGFCGGQLFTTRAGAKHAKLIGRERLVDSPIADSAPAWSPDGKWIAFSRFVYRGYHGVSPYLYVIRPDGSGIHRLGNMHGDNPSWSPDGQHIVFSNGRGIHVIRSDGSGLVAISDVARWEADPAWSSDGREIAFVRRGGRCSSCVDLWVMNADGTNSRRVADGAISPAWRPR